MGWCCAEKLTISLKLIAENFEYPVQTADRPKPTAEFHINRRRQNKNTLPLQTNTPTAISNFHIDVYMLELVSF